MAHEQDRILIASDYAEPMIARLKAAGAPGVFLAGVSDAVAERLLVEKPRYVFTVREDSSPSTLYAAMTACDSVEWIQVGGSGVDHIGAWDGARIVVTNTRGVLAPYLAEVAIGAMVSLRFGFQAYAASQAARAWAPREFRPLGGDTLAIIGHGAIGDEVAKRAKAFGLRVIGLRRSAATSEHVDEMRGPDRLMETLAEADIVSLHLRMNAETAKLFDARLFAAMKPGALFVNTSRGGVVDEPALIAALESGRLSGAYLDVTAEEPLPASSPLWAAPNLILTPHCSDQIVDWRMKHFEFFMANLARKRRGEALLNPVAPPAQ